MIAPRSSTRSGRGATALGLISFAVACLCLALLAAPASATVSYPSPQTLSDIGQDAGAPQVAIDSSGRATIVWGRFDSSNLRIQSVRLGADGTPGPVQTLSAAGETGLRPQVAIDGSGRATVVWARSDGSNKRIQSVQISAAGTPGAVQTLSNSGQDADNPQVAIDGSGRATVVWARSDGSNNRVQSMRLDADGTAGPFFFNLSAIGQSAGDAQIAIDGSDRATVTWTQDDGSNYRIRSARLAAGGSGAPGPVQTLSAPDQDAYLPQIAIDSSDRATIVWQRSDGSYSRIQSVRLAADGAPGPFQTLSAPGQTANYPQVALDGSDRATIVWQRSDGSNSRAQSVRLGADGTAGPVQTLSAPGQTAHEAQVAIDGAGRATIAWAGFEGFPLLEAPARSVRLTADGTPGPVQTLSGEDARLPQLAIDGSGRATIVWQRSDGSNSRIQSTRANIAYPETTITSGPSGPTNDTAPSFEFTDALPTTTYECSLDSGGWSACVSPRSYPNLADGPHGFAVRSVDLEGDTDPTPAERSFTVDTKLNGSASAKKKQRQKGSKIVIKAEVTAGEGLDASATGKVKVGKKSYKLKSASKSVASGEKKTLKLKPKKSKDAKKIAKALKQGEKAKAKLTVKLTDEVGNKKSKKLKVKLKR